MTRYFVSRSGEWYRLSPKGDVHVLETNGVVHILKGPPLDFTNLIESSVLKETDKKNWVQACHWFRKFPGSFIQ